MAQFTMRRIFSTSSRRIALLSLASLCLVGVARSAAPKPKPGKAAVPEAPHYGNAESISQEEMKIYLYFLASDQLEGRNLPSRGFDTAALYVASHLAEWGLKPGGSTTGTIGPLEPYFMPIELVAQTIVPADSKASVSGAAGRGGRGGRGGGRGGGVQGGNGADADGFEPPPAPPEVSPVHVEPRPKLPDTGANSSAEGGLAAMALALMIGGGVAVRRGRHRREG